MEKLFKDTALHYCANQALVDECWDELAKHYGSTSRFYHNLTHLENLATELSGAGMFIIDSDAVVLAIFYHDAIYKATSKDNEERSAALASKRLAGLSFPEPGIRKCVEIILATKTHVQHADEDVNYFTDADLSVLGKPWPSYEAYYKNVRQEYSIYPDLLYNPGRKKVLKHFLSMERIYKTEHFYGLYEERARENMRREMGAL